MHSRSRPIIVVGTLAFLALFVWLALSADSGLGLASLDPGITDYIRPMRTPALDRVFEWISLPFNPIPATVLTICVAALLWIRGRRPGAVLMLATMAVSTVLKSGISDLVGRARPDAALALIPLPGSFAFPSGHSLASAVFFGTLAFLASREVERTGQRIVIAVAAIIATVLVGVSRIYLGVHWMTDVLGSWILTGALLVPMCGAYVALIGKRHVPGPTAFSKR